MNKRFSWQSICVIALALVFVTVLASAVSACPSCKAGLAADDPDKIRIAKGYFWSIIFMMSMPFALLGSFGTYFYIEVRRARNAPPANVRR